MSKAKVIRRAGWVHNCKTDEDVLFGMDVETMLDHLPEEPIFDLIVTSPPYNIGK